MNLKKLKITHKGMYWGLIATFLMLYAFVAFVSTLHAIDFFKLANPTGLAVLLGIAYEVGQASVLFSILMTKNKEKYLPWFLMFLLTGLQITANVYASFKHMMTSGSTDWQYWQKSILFGVQASSPEMYQVIISWISGALLPIIALGMTALVAQNIKMATEEDELEEIAEIPDKSTIADLHEEIEYLKKHLHEATTPAEAKQQDISPELSEAIISKTKKYDEAQELNVDPRVLDNMPMRPETSSGEIFPSHDHLSPISKTVVPYNPDLDAEVEELQTAAKKADEIKVLDEKPHNDSDVPKKIPKTLKRGWHLKKRYVDSNGDVYEHGVFQPQAKGEPENPESPKKVMGQG